MGGFELPLVPGGGGGGHTWKGKSGNGTHQKVLVEARGEKAQWPESGWCQWCWGKADSGSVWKVGPTG